MTPNSFVKIINTSSSKNFSFSTTLLMVCLFFLTSCNVDASFGYALGGTFAVMLVGLVIATFVTGRNKKKSGEK
ncbi:hypothetical protein Q0590_18895 [Rhodocytophaga aerolata]|uniref:Phosphatidate cytidylyltransferase n=1 Tax=Rhodocytophaga aerolata TaxID=455078 RepID=A0ABT8R8C4_9BACT|nr:hypothetical protein [Rhodocytophaga aerolata]MDO1448351.1 hypothetical protein [Rhodocytophaga aerolata]